MAINPIDVPCVKPITISHSSLNHYKHGNSPASRLVKLDFAQQDSISNLTYKHWKYKNNFDFKSPYIKKSNHHILGDSVQMLSRVTEKRIIHKNGGNMSSFPLASNIYKANSDELKARQNNKKVLKSVLTLPNNESPQLCTVSDINDSENVNGNDDLRRKTKRTAQAQMRKCRRYFKGREVESQNCSDIDFHLDSSSTDTIKKCEDGKRIHKSTAESKGKLKEKVKPHDVWAVLRNMNRFQFQTSPQISENNFSVHKQKKNFKRRNNRKDMRVFETRRTEEFAYISRYKVDKSPTLSRCSSFDKITVIDRNQDFKVNREIENKPKRKKNGKLLGPRAIKSSPKNKTPLPKQNNLKAITYINQKKNNNMDNNDKAPSFVICPNYGEVKGILNNNASVDLGYESKTTENDEDFLSFDLNTTNTTQASQFSQSKLSDNSGSSKAPVFTKQIIRKKDNPTAKPKPKVEPHKQINGITKVILSRGQNVEHSLQDNKIEPLRRNVRHATETPFGPPKLTKTEINRQLQKYKFPIVILGKDQLRSSIQVVSTEHPQFDGLENQIWPFMESWYGIDQPVKVIKKQITQNIHNKKTKFNEIENKVLSKNNVPKPTKISDKISVIEPKRTPLPLSDIINQKTQNQRKLKPIKQLKDRMLKLLYKNSSVISMIDGLPIPDTDKNENIATVDICSQDKCNTKIPPVKVKKAIIQTSTEKRPWAKAKWASDFIESVIKKIKSGAYYNQDGINKVYNETLVLEKKEIEIQTDSVSDVTTNADPDVLLQQIAIPGFDNGLPALEIKTMSINEIAVKHCGTNIMVHFDVTVPTNSLVGVKSDCFSLIPIDVTKSLTKVFKCQTSILNAMLPAELCSILPKMLRDIADSGQHVAVFTAPIDMSCLTTISEVPVRPESVIEIPKSILPPSNILPLMPMAPKLRQLLNGGYFKTDVNTTSKFHVLRDTSCLIKDERRLAEEMRHYIERIHLFELEMKILMPVNLKYTAKPKILPIATNKTIDTINTCTALQPYPVKNLGLVAMPRPFSLMNIFETMASYINNLGLSWFRMIKTDNLATNMDMGKYLTAPNVLSLRIGNLKTDSFKDCSRYSCKISILPTSTAIQTTDNDKAIVPASKFMDKVKLSASNDKTLGSTSINSNRVRRKGYIKLFRKCKSSSNISGEKVTPLNRITNLDDFLQVLGPGKLLWGVFDGQSGNKIMSSIKELKNWTTEINPKQALLVILLANKKESPNLLRYTPMLLQGIAVKRITKASELDLEIEVIERENLNGVSRFEGISYLPASIENQDSLYEELCWIAKNTASDYQRPFDHTSEKLIKSLLEKRKQLNPSYLRVMARYVGLGLLKSPRKMQ